MEEERHHDIGEEAPDDLEEIAAIVVAMHRQRAGKRRAASSGEGVVDSWVSAARREQHSRGN
jgi:hypothetical protein